MGRDIGAGRATIRFRQRAHDPKRRVFGFVGVAARAVFRPVPLFVREPPPPAYAIGTSGVDLTLIDATLALSVIERIRQNDRAAEVARSLQAAFAARHDRIDTPRPR